MNDRKGLDATDYIVGYGRPPKERQFAAGKSGNPKGRPKGSRTMGAMLQDILNQKIAVTENGKTRRIPTQASSAQPRCSWWLHSVTC
jgi:hypothetical protein